MASRSEEAKQSSSSTEQGGDVGAAGGAGPSIDPKVQATKILNFVEKRREQRADHLSATTLSSVTFTDAQAAKLYKMMGCHDCDSIPHPLRRFGCVRGHLYCQKCVMTRGPNAICGFPMSSDILEEVGFSHGKLPPSEDAVSRRQDQMKKLKEEQAAGACLREVQRLTKADPLYTQLFGNATWVCPFVYSTPLKGEEKCISRGIEGWNIHHHLRKCLQGEGQPRKKE